PTDIESPWRHLKIIGRYDLKPRRADLYRGRAVDGLGASLECDPATRIARHSPAIEAEIEQFLHSGGVQYRDAGIHKGIFGLMRQGRRFACMIIACEQQHSSVLRRAGGVAVLECVATAVDAGSLGVPQGE